MNISKKTYVKLLIGFLLVTNLFILPLNVSANSLPRDSWWEMIYTEESVPSVSSDDPKYRTTNLENPHSSLLRVDDFQPYFFSYNSEWDLEIISPNGYNKSWGTIPLLRPTNESKVGLGRSFTSSDAADLRQWGERMNGNGDFVAQTLPTVIQEYVSGREHKMAYIRDVVERAGATLEIMENGEQDSDGFDLATIYVQATKKPDAEISCPSDAKVGEQVTCQINGKSYVPSSSAFYANGVEWKIETEGREIESGRTSQASFSSTFQHSFTSEGVKEFTIEVKDQVMRAQTDYASIYINSDETSTSEPEPDPGDGGGGSGGPAPSCNPPSVIGGELRYEYEVDLSVEEIEGETVDRNNTTETPVEVYRDDFSDNRADARGEIERDLSDAESEKQQLDSELSTLESELATLESELEMLETELSKAESDYADAERDLSAAKNDLSSAESDLRSCEQQPLDEAGNEPDCSAEQRAVNQAESDVSAAQEAVEDADLRIAALEQMITEKEAEIESKEQEIADKKCEVETKKSEIRGFEEELAELDRIESDMRTVSTNVDLTFGWRSVGSERVYLREGQTDHLTYRWTLPSDGSVEAEINPYRNLDFPEVTYSNNAMDTPIYISTHETSACAAPGDEVSMSAVVRTITDDYGTDRLYERIEASIENKTKDEIRAGYGFSYKLETDYTNEDSTSSATGIKNANSFMPSISNHLPYSQRSEGYQIAMDNTSYYPRTFALPEVFVEEYSGNVFTSPVHPLRDTDDQIINGGRKHYIPFKEPDGLYSFTVRGYDAGVNQLNVCLSDNVVVNGTWTGDGDGDDDFVPRSVSPDEPFNGGVGWNWKGETSAITSLYDWYYEWSYKNPDSLPSTYESSVELTQERLQMIRDYNATHEGEFSLDQQFEQLLP